MTPRRDPPPRTIDWAEIHARLDLAAAASGEALHPSPERARAVMDERARSLARAPETTPDAAEVLEAVLFRLAGERYAIEARLVRRVVRFESPTPIPGAPEFLLGVINQRGEVLAVFDLRALLGVGAGADDPEGVLVLGDDRDEFGVVADSVQETVTLRIDAVLEPAGAAGSVGRRYVRGVTSDALIVLDGAALLRDEQLVIEQGDDPAA